MNGPANQSTAWIGGTIDVEVQPTGWPKPVGYIVKVRGNVVASLTPSDVENAYKRFQELADARRDSMIRFSDGQR